MTISRELFLALLSLDSYYRGPSPTDGSEQNVIPTDGIGGASAVWGFGPAEEGLPDWDDVGFFASVYVVGSADVEGLTGDTVIAYRGTDNFNINLGALLGGNNPIGEQSDITNGWAVGAGDYTAPQAQLAIDLYEQILGAPIGEGDAGSIELTGHSLGGGLAGFVSALSGSKAIGYDHMPFMLAAFLGANDDVVARLNELTFEAGFDTKTIEEVFALFSQVTLPDYDNFEGIALDGEALQTLRNYFTVSTGTILDMLKDKAEGLVDEYIERALTKYGLAYEGATDLVNMGLGWALDTLLGALPEDPTGIVPTVTELAEKLVAAMTIQFGENARVTDLDDYGWDPVSYEALSEILEVLNPITDLFKDVSGQVPVRAVYPAIGSAATLLTLAVQVSEFVNNTVIRGADAVIKHDLSTLVLLQFAADNDDKYAKWHAGVDLALGDLPDLALSALSSGPAGSLALKDSAYASFNRDAEAGPKQALRNAIAYSAIDHGDRPFGDTGIHAYFNDLHELGTVLEAGDVSPLFRDEPFLFFDLFSDEKINTGLTQALVRIAAEYAGALALNGVQEDTDADVESREGVLTISDDEKTLALDMSELLWLDVLAGGKLGIHGGYTGSESLAIDSQAELIAAYYSRSSETSTWWGGLLGVETVNTEELDRLSQLVWKRDVGALDRIHYATKIDASEITLPDRSYAVTVIEGEEAQVDVYLGIEEADTVYGTSGNDFIAMGDGDDVVYGRLGRDLLLGGAGNDLMVDELNASDADGNRRNDPDVYVGDPVEGGLLENLANFLTNLPDAWFNEDIVRYSMLDPRDDSYAGKGVEVVSATVGDFGGDESVELELKDLNNDSKAKDTLVEIEKVVLTERADTVKLSNEMREAPIWIDLGLGIPDGSFGKGDYDIVDYSGLGGGVIVVNGSTENNETPNQGFDEVGYLTLISEVVGAAIGVPTAASGLFEFEKNDPLRVTGAEKVVLTSNDDVLWYGDIGLLAGIATGWPRGDEYSRFGEIKGGKGNDVLIVRQPEFISQGAAIDARFDESPKAAGDLRMEIDGGEGDDRLIVVGGRGAITVGGAGSDFILNWSEKGQLFGDGIDGRGGNPDVFWWSPGAFIMDAEKHDRLQMFGVPLVGGFGSADYGVAMDWLLPFVFYGLTESNQLLVNWFGFGDDVLGNTMVVENFTFGESENDFGVSSVGDLGMTFRIYGAGDEMSVWNALWGHLMSYIKALQIFAKSLSWNTSDDPLVIDLDGDGVETSKVGFGVKFDLDGDGFAQQTGWVGPDDALLARDLDGNGRIDGIHELFGAPGVSGFSMLAALDSNADSVVSALDAEFGSLLLWRDLDQDGYTDAGELATLAQAGVASIGVVGTPLNLTVANLNTFVSEASVTFADGRVHDVVEVVFDQNPVDTQWLGEAGAKPWNDGSDVHGYGKLTWLAAAAAHDFAVDAAVKVAQAQMTVGDIALLRTQAQPVFEAWSNALTQSRELVPVRLSEGGELLDRGVYVEDAAGGYWRLASGAVVTDGGGAPIARPTLQQVLAQAAGWQLEQMWSPADRGALPAQRDAAPYLVQVVDGRAVVLDRGIEITDALGSYWQLASGSPVTGAGGAPIARPQQADVLAQTAATGTEWRSEVFAVAESPFPFEKFAVYFKGGKLTDYAVQVTDEAGSFFVWANNLRLALDVQARTGSADGFALRNYALDLDNLKDADNTVDSYVRAEIVSGAQIRFAAAAYGIVFEPELLMASIDAAGVIAYDAPLDGTIEFMGDLMEHYSFFSRAAALRLAAQGGLADFFRGLEYDVAADAWAPNSGRELTPMFEAIFERAPDGRDATIAYLEKWSEVLDVVYADFRRHSAGPKSEAFVLQMVLGAYENTPGLDVELLKAAELFGVDEERVIQHETTATAVDGTSGDDYIVIGEGDQIFRGGLGKDVYVVGKNFGNDIIEDIEPPLGPRANDSLRFAHVASTDVYAWKNGIDLVIDVLSTGDRLTVRNQFEGALPGLFGGDFSNDTEMVEIAFADGVTWREIEIAFATSHPLDSDDLVLGTPDIDVLDGGKGDDLLRGGRESDLYLFDRGYGLDRIEDDNDNILVKAYDVVQFGPSLRPEHLRFKRLGDADDLIVTLVDDRGVPTGEQLVVQNQFQAVNTWVFGVIWLDRVERFVFEDGSYFDEAQIMQKVIEQAKTDNEDAIFGFHARDKLDGGKANDYLSGGDDSDTYVFAPGYGHDVIEDNLSDFLTASYDVLQIGGNLKPDDIALEREHGSLTVSLQVVGSADRITLVNQFRLTSTVLFGDYYYDNVDEVRFNDGAGWDSDTIARRLLEAARTDGDDHIIGFDRNDTLDGGPGTDRLEGGIYSDTYVFARGHGAETIYDHSRDPLLAPGRDTLDLQGINFADIEISRFKENLIFTVKGTGDTVTLERQYNRFGGQENAVESLKFADQLVPHTDLNPEDVDLVGTAGSDTLWGTHFPETIDGLAGDDTLIGSSDGDRYRFDVGYGNDVVIDVQETRQWFNDDHIEFGADITVDNVRFTKDGNDLLITIAERADTLRVRDQFGSQLAGAEQFHFHDGTTWSIEDVEELLLIAGGGRGDDVITGLIDRDNILDGRQGDDQLFGGRASDTYLFGLGYDLDSVTEVLNAQSFDGAVDRVVFGTLITPDALQVRRGGAADADLIFTLPESGDELRVIDGLSQRWVERFEFADGTLWTLDGVRLAMLRGTPGDDRLLGFDLSNDVLAGGRGNDELVGGSGDDVFRFHIGDGADSVADSGGNERIEFGELISAQMLQLGRDGDHLVIHLQGFADDSLVLLDVLGTTDASRRIEQFHFADGLVLDFDSLRQALLDSQGTPGNDIVRGFDDRDDIIDGRAGADELIGGWGNDQYRFTSGHGLDLVDDRGSQNSAADRIDFTDRGSAEASVRRAHPQRQDVVISFAGSGDEVLIKGGLESGTASSIEQVAFADGVVWTIADLRARVLAGAQTDGADIVTGFASADVIEPGLGDDQAFGGGGSDTYVFTRGDGRDLVRDDSANTAEVDVLRLNAYVPSDVRVVLPQPDRPDLLLLFDATRDEILLRDQFNAAAGRGLERVEFGDGTVWIRTDLVNRIAGGGTAADELITGTAGTDTLVGRGGNDTVSGGNGSDTYVFARGDGRDRVEDNGSGSTDVVRIDGYAATDLRFARAVDDRAALEISFAGSADAIRIVNALYSDSGDQIERIEVVDPAGGNAAWTVAQIKQLLVTPADPLADNEITGFDSNDTLAGGLGDDFLSGERGSDTYVWRRNDGHDVIDDNGISADDVVQLVQIDPDEVVLSRVPGDAASVLLTVPLTLGSLRITDTLFSDNADQIERFVFDDGTVWSIANVKARLVAAQATPDSDRINGFESNDTLRGGAGNDTVTGGRGSDTYEFSAGDGFDEIYDDGIFATDVLRLIGVAPADVALALVPGARDSLDLTLPGGGGRVRLIDTLDSSAGGQIEEIRFDGAVTWTIAEVKARLVAQQSSAGNDWIEGFDGNDTLAGGAGNDTVLGGRGSDAYLWGVGDGDDLIVDAGIFSTDVVRLVGLNPTDVSFSRALDAADTLLIRINAHGQTLRVWNTLDNDAGDQIERFEFADGTVWTAAEAATRAGAAATPVAGTNGADTLESGPSAELLRGGDGNDSYVWARGDGADVIDEPGTFDGTADRLVLQSVLPAQVTLGRDGNDALLKVADSAAGAGDGATLRLREAFDPYFERGVERIEFDDGTVWTPATLRAAWIASQQTAGNDRVIAFASADALQAGRGDDLMVGGDGNDSYVYNRGDGHDLIDDSGALAGQDLVELRGVAVAAISVSASGNDAVLTIAESAPGAGDGGSVQLVQSLDPYFSRGIERIRFDDGTEWTPATLRTMLVEQAQTEGDDFIAGWSTGETFEAGRGDDEITGNGGDDTHVYNRGDGHDAIDETIAVGGGFDQIQLRGLTPDAVTVRREGNHARLSIAESAPDAGDAGSIFIRDTLDPYFERGVERYVFDDGTVWSAEDLRQRLLADASGPEGRRIDGFGGADQFDGGGGADHLLGGSGNDRYVWRRGDGADIIEESTFQGLDTLALIGIAVDDVRVVQGDGEHLELRVADSAPGAGDGAWLVLKNSLSPYFDQGVERVEFDDGTVWDALALRTQALANAQTAGDDVIRGSTVADNLLFGAGRDQLRGGGGGDTYVFTRGDGRDLAEDNGTEGDPDTVEFRGYAAAEARFIRVEAGSNDLLVRLAGDDAVTVINGLTGTVPDTIEQFRFVDAGGAVTATLTLAEIAARLVLDLRTDGADLIVGTGAADMLAGGLGPDVLDGAVADDIFVYRRGDGDDRIEDSGNSLADVLRLPDFIVADLVSLRRSPPAGMDLVLNFANGDRVVLRDALLDSAIDGARGIDRIEFGDGTVWTAAEFAALVLADTPTDGDESVHGFDGDDTVTGGRGNDHLHGGDGSDLYRYARGDGQDVIEDNGRAGNGGETDRIEIAGYASTEVSVSRWYKADDGVVLRFAGSTDTLTVLNTLSGSAEDAIEQIAFADGVVWGTAELLAALDNRSPVATADGLFVAVQGRERRFAPGELLSNDFDPDGDALRIVAAGNADVGSVALADDGRVVYTAPLGYSGNARFDYTLSDGRNGLATTTVDLRVRPPASATDDSGFSTAEETLLTIRAARLLANDFDGDLMLVSQVKDAVGGTVALASNGDISFVPALDFNGSASFRYVANTPDGGRAEAGVTIAVTPVNDAPVARDDAGISFDEGGSILVSPADLLRNDSDIDGDRLRVSAVAGDANVEAEFDPSGRIRLNAEPDYFGPALITYTVEDGAGGSAVARLRVTVDPVNDAPRPLDDALVTDEDTPIFLPVADLLGNDSDPEFNPLEVNRVFGFERGRAELFPNGTILFRPDDDTFGQASFRYEVNDGQGAVASAKVVVQVNPTNDPPNARNEAYDSPGVDWLSGVEDQAVSIPIARLLFNDSDKDSAAITLASVSSPSHGSVAIVGNEVVFTPDPGWWGEASFFYVASDGDGGVDDAEVTLYFEPTADAPPVAGNDEITMFEDVTAVVEMATLLANDTDIDGDRLVINWIRPFSVLDAARVDLSYEDDGDLLIAPLANFHGRVTLVYEVSDGADGTDVGSVTLNIESVNDDPVATDDSAATSLDAPLVVRLSDLPLNDNDIDVEDVEDLPLILRVLGVSDPSVGTLSVYGGEFAVLEQPVGFSGPLSFLYTLGDELDGTDVGTVNATVAAEHADVISGSGRRDLLIGSPLTERLESFSGSDDLYGRGGNDDLVGGDDADRLDGGEGRDRASYVGSNIGVRADLQARIGQGGHAQGDAYFNVEDLTGSGFNDQLYGDGGANALDGAGGNDLLDGREGGDALAGGAGRDLLIGGLGADDLDGGEGDADVASYADALEAVDVSLQRGTGLGGEAEGDALVRIEELVGSIHPDRLEGDAGANRLAGGRGADTLLGGGGDDWFDGGRDGDEMQGGDGIDTADYSGSLAGVVVDLSGQSAGGGDAEGDSYSGVENVRGSFHADQITGNALDNLIEGGEGADTVTGGGGFDSASYRASAGAVVVDLQTGLGSGGEAEGDSLSGIAALVGSEYDDVLRGDAGANRFDGGFGTDTIEGRGGSDDYVFGFGARDDLVVDAGDASDLDRIVMAGEVRPGDVGLVRRGADLLIELEKGPGFLVDTITVQGHFDGQASGIEQIVFGDGTVWDRDDIDARTRDGRFNAINDLVRWADEDVPYPIAASRLLGNDSEIADDPSLRIVSVGNARNGNAVLEADGSVTFIGTADFNGNAFFDYTAEDGTGRQSTATARVVVRPVNDSPVALPDGVFQAVEDTVLEIPIASLLANDSDVDLDTLRISAFGPLLDENGNPIGEEVDGGFFGAGTNGVVSVDLFGPNLLFVGFPDYFGAAGFHYELSDGAGGKATANVEIQIAAVNDAPRPKDDAVSTRMDQVLRLEPTGLTRNDVDPERDAITLLRVRFAEHGTVEIDATGQIVFTPEVGYIGPAKFEYVVADERGLEASGQVAVTVLPPNDPPRPRDDRFLLEEDSPLVLSPSQLLANDSDPNGDVLFVSRLDEFPEKGTVAFDEVGNIVFNPKPNYNGDASFYYWASDGRGGETRANVLLEVRPDNDNPFVNDDVPLSTPEDTPLDIPASALLGNDGDPDGDVLSFGALEVEEGGVFRTADGLRYVPDRDFIGTDTVRYRAIDGKGGVSPAWASFTVTVTSVADVPTARTDRFTLKEGTPLNLTEAQLLDNDFDGDGDAIRFVALGEAVNGTVEALGGGAIRFTPAAGFFGAASFSYTISDDVDGEATGQVQITVTADNSLPVATTDRASGPEDTPVTFTIAQLLANDSDPDGDLLTFVDFIEVVDGGRATQLPGERIVFTPDDDVTGVVRFSYRISDGIGAPVQGFVDLDFSPVNDGPDAVDDVGFTLTEGLSILIPAATLLANDRDVEGDAFTLVGTDDVINGAIEIEGDSIRFTPRDGFFGGAAFTYVVRDAPGAEGRAQVSITVEPANAPPIARDDAGFGFDEDGFIEIPLANLLANDEDPEGGALAFAGIVNDFGGSAELVGDNIRFTGGRDFFGNASFDYRVRDVGGREDQAAVRISVRAMNDAPLAGNDSISTNEDQAVTVAILELIGNDRDPDRGSFQITQVGDALNGNVTLDGIGNVVFTPAAQFSGDASFNYTISDLSGETAVAAVRVRVAPVNDAPDGVDDLGLTAKRDDRLLIDPLDLLANDIDIDGDTLQFIAARGATNGQLSTDAQGRLLYVPNDGFVGIERLQYDISDGELGDSAEIVIEVLDPYVGWRQGTGGADALNGSPSQPNRIYADSGDDAVRGGLKDDLLEGGRGDDFLNGNLGNDAVGGGDGNDTLSGGAGNDTLDGGRGDDHLTGGFGADRFVFRGGADVLADFLASDGDRIEIHIPGVAGFNDLLQYATQTAEGVQFDFGAGDMLLVRGAELAAIPADWWIFP